MFAGEQSFFPLFLCSSFVWGLLSISSVFSAWSPRVWLWFMYCDSLYVNLAWSLLNFLELLSQCFSVYWGSFWLLFLQIFFSASVPFSLKIILFIIWDSNYMCVRSFGTVPNISMQLFHLFSLSPCFSLFLCCAWTPVLFIMVRKLSLGREPGWKKKTKSMMLLICLQVHQLSVISNLLLSWTSDFLLLFQLLYLLVLELSLASLCNFCLLPKFHICSLINTFSFNYLNFFFFTSLNVITANSYFKVFTYQVHNLDHISHFFMCVSDFINWMLDIVDNIFWDSGFCYFVWESINSYFLFSWNTDWSQWVCADLVLCFVVKCLFEAHGFPQAPLVWWKSISKFYLHVGLIGV